MRIVIDAQALQTGSRYRGIGHYTESLIHALLLCNRELMHPHELLLIFNAHHADVLERLRNTWQDLLPAANFKVFNSLSVATESHPHAVQQLPVSECLRQAFIEALQPDFVLITSLFEGLDDPFVCDISGNTPWPVGVIGYDLIPLISPEQYLGVPLISAWYHRKLESLRRAEVIFSISESARREFLQHLGVAAHVVVNISSASDPTYCQQAFTELQRQTAWARLNVSKPFVLYTGAADTRKNLSALLQAFAQLPADLLVRHQLVLAGKHSPAEVQRLRDLARQHGVPAKALVFTGFVTQADLNLLYNTCAVFVFPSLHEGFGLPVLEAMSCGAPVLCANTTSLPEVMARDDAMFDPLKPAELTQRLTHVLTHEPFRAALIAHGLSRAKAFSWQATAQALLAGIEPVVARHEAPANTTEPLATLAERLETLRINDSVAREAVRCFVANTRIAQGPFPSLPWRIEGPYDSSYSLALLNRETARALAALGQQVQLHATEGPGDFVPDAGFLASNPDLQAMHVASQAGTAAAVVSRNLYPPRVTGMQGETRLLHHYAWEESGFPTAWVSAFNTHLTGITCLSVHVQRILINHGVTLPLTVSGCGTDHWDRVTPVPCALQTNAFRFLHVSSCFPRKGVDVLLQAWGQAFSARDDVTLVIKTFANPHNTVAAQLAACRAARADYPDVVVLTEDLDPGALKGLMTSCHALVAPSRAEGFGLPLAEAMLSDLPVITTAWGGHTDFCTPETSWLVDYQFAPAKTHFDLFCSEWAEPCADSLATALHAVHAASPAERAQRTRRGAALLRQHFSWENAAARLIHHAVTATPQAEACHTPLRIGWLTPWNQRCGIAAYAEHLVQHHEGDQLFVLAPELDPAQRVTPDADNVIRCWRQDNHDNLQHVLWQIDRLRLDVLVIQQNAYFYDYAALTDLVLALKARGVVVTLTLHATQAPEPAKALSQLQACLAACDRIIVHAVADLNRLKAVGLTNNVVRFPIPVASPEPASMPWPHAGKRCIAAYGFALPHKGLDMLLEAFAQLLPTHPDLVLLLLNAEHPDSSSAACIAHLHATIDRLGLAEWVHTEHRYLTDAESLGLLRQTDLIALPYQHTLESSSAAAQFALGAGVPVWVTPLAIFDDVAPAVSRFSGYDVPALREGLAQALAGERHTTPERLAAWQAAHHGKTVSKRLFGMLRSLWINRSPATASQPL